MNSEQKVKMRPILFSTPMVQAILEGRKTMTRRVINPQPTLSADNCPDRAKIVNALCGTDDALFYFWKHFPLPGFPDNTEHLLKYCPYGQVGDVLWCRESFNLYENFGDCSIGCEYGCKHGKYVYKATGNWNDEAKWKPSIHMPFDACRLFLQITDIRIERLQNITEEDAVLEGIAPLFMSGAQLVQYGQLYSDYSRPKELFADGLYPIDSFRTLINSINGPGTWDRNDWVWVVSFARVDKPC